MVGRYRSSILLNDWMETARTQAILPTGHFDNSQPLIFLPLFSRAAPGAEVSQQRHAGRISCEKQHMKTAHMRGDSRAFAQLAAICDASKASNRVFFAAVSRHISGESPRPSPLYAPRGKGQKGHKGGWRSLRCGRHSRQPPCPYASVLGKERTGIDQSEMLIGAITLCEDFMDGTK